MSDYPWQKGPKERAPTDQSVADFGAARPFVDGNSPQPLHVPVGSTDRDSRNIRIESLCATGRGYIHH